MSLPRWILRTATHNPPAPLNDWALAMRREFDELQGGELSWALGCAAAMVFARLKVERWFWAMVLATPLIMSYVTSDLVFKGVVDGWIPREALRHYATLWVTVAALGAFPFAVLIGFYRPARALAPMLIGGLFFDHVFLAEWTSLSMDQPYLGWWGLNATLYGAPPFIGLAANLAAWYAGARTGGWLRVARAPA